MQRRFAICSGKTAKAAARLLEQVEIGVAAAISQADRYARRHKDASAFVERFVSVMRAGLARIKP